MRSSLVSFLGKAREPRRIIWGSATLMVLVTVLIVALGFTSTRWYCSNGCHRVQDDTIRAYNHSAHSQVACITCHIPVGGSPVVFTADKLVGLGQLAMTVSNDFQLPLNKQDDVALTMESNQCTQCHEPSKLRKVSKSGMKMDHQIHASKGIACTICHNRAAHQEDFTPTLVDPKGSHNAAHPNFLDMTACFRCHGREPGSPATGTCTACHPAGSSPRPASHDKADFITWRHGALAKEAWDVEARALRRAGEPTVTPQSKAAWTKLSPDSRATLGEKLVPASAVYYCGMCHAPNFCDDCHGLRIPHSDEFKKPPDASDPLGHPAISKLEPNACVMCHTGTNPNFCVSCHHGKTLHHKYNPAQPWLKVHPLVAQPGTLGNCYRPPLGKGCHDQKTCTDCHFENLWKRRPQP